METKEEDVGTELEDISPSGDKTESREEPVESETLQPLQAGAGSSQEVSSDVHKSEYLKAHRVKRRNCTHSPEKQ